MTDVDVAAWAERHLTLPAGAPLELAPWQRTMLADLQRSPGERRRLELVGGRRSARRQATAQAIAASVLLGERVLVCAGDSASARALYDAAVAELDALGDTLGVDVEPFVVRLREARS